MNHRSMRTNQLFKFYNTSTKQTFIIRTHALQHRGIVFFYHTPPLEVVVKAQGEASSAAPLELGGVKGLV